MRRNIEYNREDMIQWLKNHFQKHGYNVDRYSDNFLPARVPLYCQKEQKGKIDEIVIDITTASTTSKETFFQTETIDGVKIHEASSIRFYQYYFIQAKTYLAFPDYIKENEDFDEFKKVCIERGIGVLKISKTEFKEIVKPRPLFEEICKNLGIKTKDKKQELEYQLRNCLHYFVYYPEPIFKKRAITGRTEGNISFILIDKLLELNHLIYKDELQKLAFKYRQEARDDYEIAEDYITNLWKKYLGLSYPNIQRRVENILQRDEEYREHFVHQFQVFLIGSYILDKIYPKIAPNYNKRTKCKIEKVWLASSTFHDFNYGLQNFDTWLMEFFQETLRVKNNQTKEKLNILNLDAAMIREALYDNIIKIVNQMNSNLKQDQRETLIRFFYEKAVRDRNHGILSAISLLKLYYDSNQSQKINEQGILDAAIGISCHDEDIWEALCGCQGFRRSDLSLPTDDDECANNCNRLLWPIKSSKIYKEKFSQGIKPENIKDKCEDWERNLMEKELLDKISFRKYPILFLLIYCDSVQDEGRVTSSDEYISKNRSTLNDIKIERTNGKTIITVMLDAEDPHPKELEIERLAWCLFDDRFNIDINNKPIKLNRK